MEPCHRCRYYTGAASYVNIGQACALKALTPEVIRKERCESFEPKQTG